MAKSIVEPALTAMFACTIAARSEPAPLSLVVVTGIVASSSRRSKSSTPTQVVCLPFRALFADETSRADSFASPVGEMAVRRSLIAAPDVTLRTSVTFPSICVVFCSRCVTVKLVQPTTLGMVGSSVQLIHARVHLSPVDSFATHLRCQRWRLSR